MGFADRPIRPLGGGTWFISGSLGIAVTVLVALAFRNRLTDLRSARDFDRVLSPDDWLASGQLVVSFNGKALHSVSRTYLALWNHRGSTVYARNIVEEDPLRIEVSDDDEIIHARLVSCSRAQIGVSIGRQSQGARVSFKSLEQHDGFIIEVTHRGTSPARLAGGIHDLALVKRGHYPWGRIRPPFSCDMSPEAREHMKQPRLFRDLLASVVDWMRIAVGVVMLALVCAMSVALWTRPSPTVAPVAEYDLTSTGGQAAFANAVLAQSVDASELLVMSAMLAVFIGWNVTWIVRAIRALSHRVPNWILNVCANADPPINSDAHEDATAVIQ